jgi:hypothetical protein
MMRKPLACLWGMSIYQQTIPIDTKFNTKHSLAVAAVKCPALPAVRVNLGEAPVHLVGPTRIQGGPSDIEVHQSLDLAVNEEGPICPPSINIQTKGNFPHSAENSPKGFAWACGQGMDIGGGRSMGDQCCSHPFLAVVVVPFAAGLPLVNHHFMPLAPPWCSIWPLKGQGNFYSSLKGNFKGWVLWWKHQRGRWKCIPNKFISTDFSPPRISCQSFRFKISQICLWICHQKYAILIFWQKKFL